jgi:mannosyltransferase
MSHSAESKAPPAEPDAPERAETPVQRRGLRREWLALIPALLTFVVGLYGITGPSFTQDEDATLLAVHRTFPQMVSLLGRVDVVHGAYYSLIWVVSRLFGTSELAVRFPSAVAMAVAAGGVALLGQRLVSTEAGLGAGLVFTVLPSVSFFAEDARDYAVVTALAVVASYIFVRALDSTSRRRRWLIAYGVALAALGLANLFALLIILAHAIALASRARSDPRIGRTFVVGWLAAVVAAVVAVSPVAVTAEGQNRQISWIKPLKLGDVLSVQRLAGPQQLFWGIIVIVLTTVLCGALIGRQWRHTRWPQPLVALALPWLVLPPAVLLIVSAFDPIYTFRYIAFCIPALALLAGTALAALGRVIGVIGLIVILLVGLPTQISQRGPDGHSFNIRRVDKIVARYERPGDAVLNVSNHPGNPAQNRGGRVYERALEIGYPYGLSRLNDVSRGQSAVQSVSMGGTYAPVSVQRQRLATVARVWVVGGKTKNVSIVRGLGFTLVRRWHITNVWVRLYARNPGAAATSGGS